MPTVQGSVYDVNGVNKVTGGLNYAYMQEDGGSTVTCSLSGGSYSFGVTTGLSVVIGYTGSYTSFGTPNPPDGWSYAGGEWHINSFPAGNVTNVDFQETS